MRSSPSACSVPVPLVLTNRLPLLIELVSRFCCFSLQVLQHSESPLRFFFPSSHPGYNRHAFLFELYAWTLTEIYLEKVYALFHNSPALSLLGWRHQVVAALSALVILACCKDSFMQSHGSAAVWAKPDISINISSWVQDQVTSCLIMSYHYWFSPKSQIIALMLSQRLKL